MSKKVAQLSDLHIPVSDRRQEYKQVFTNLISSLKEKSPDMIVITGDIFHSKAHLSPEAVELFYDLMSDLRDIAPVYLITGNHDAVLSAKETRLDALSPLVNGYNKGLPEDQQIVYWKDSGVYDSILAEYQFVVYSLMDEGQPDLTTLDKNKKHVALFHGIVSGASYYTEKEAEPSLQAININWEQFDAVMLGDIHKPQQIKDLNMFYAGSLLQRDFGEHPSQHGYILWEDLKPKFVKVPNEYGFYRCIYDGTWKIPEEPTKLSTVDISYPPHFTEREVIKEAKKKFKTQKLLFNVIKETDGKELTINKEVVDLYSLEQQQEIFKEYFADEKPELTSKILQLNKEVYSEVKDQYPSISRGKRWELKSDTFKNLFAYGTGNYFNFEDKGGVYGLFSKNRAGKSSFLNTIPFGLYGNLPSISRVDEVINTDKNEYEVKLEANIGEDEYEIIRSGKRTKSGSSNNIKLIKNGESIGGTNRETDKEIEELFGDYDTFFRVFYISQGNNKTFLDLTPTERNNWMYKNLGADVFEFSHVFGKDKLKRLGAVIDEYKEVDFDRELNILDLDRASKKNEIDKVNKQIEAISDEIKGIQKEIDSITIHDIDEEKEKRKYEDAVSELKELESQKELYEQKLNKFSSMSEEEKISEHFGEEKAKIKMFKGQKESGKNSIESFKEDMKNDVPTPIEKASSDKAERIKEDGQKLTERINELEKELSERKTYDLEELRKSKDERKEKEQDLKLELHSIKTIEDKIEEISKECENEKKLCDVCPYGQNKEERVQKKEELENELKESQEKIDVINIKLNSNDSPLITEKQFNLYAQYEKDTEDLKKEISDLKQERKDLRNDYKVLSQKIESLKDQRKSKYEMEIKEIELSIKDTENKVNSILSEVRSKLKDILTGYEKSISEAESLMKDHQKIISGYEEIKNKIEENKKRKLQKEELISTRNTKESEKEDLDNERVSLQVEINSIQDEIDKMEIKQEELKDKKVEYNLLEKYVKATHKNEIPLFFLKNMISFIETEVNKVISWMDDFRINLYVEDNNIISEITQHGKTWSTNLTSGMETFVINLAFRMAISNMGNISRPNFVFVDEGFGALDADNIQNIPNVFRYLQSQFDHVLVISHDDFMRDMVDRIIDIEKIDGTSRLI